MIISNFKEKREDLSKTLSDMRKKGENTLIEEIN